MGVTTDRDITTVAVSTIRRITFEEGRVHVEIAGTGKHLVADVVNGVRAEVGHLVRDCAGNVIWFREEK